MKKIFHYKELVKAIEAGEFVVPITSEIDLTNKCQLNCQFCFYKKQRVGGEELDYDYLCALFDEFAELGVKSITLTGGGEPLAYDLADEVIDEALMRGLEVGLITNGVALEKIHDPAKLQFIRISLDAADSEGYKRVKGEDYFHKVLQNIDYCLKGGAYIGLSYVLYNSNQDGVRAAQSLANLMGVKYLQFKPAWINGDMFEIPEGIQKIICGSKTISTKRYVFRNRLACHVAGLIGIVCADGNVYYCCQHRGKRSYQLGSIYEERFKTIWSRRKNIIIPDINKCPHCRYMNYAQDLIEGVWQGTKIDESRHLNFL